MPTDPPKPPPPPTGGDPGIHIFLDFPAYSAPKKVHWVNVDVFLDIPEQQKTRGIEGVRVSENKFQHHVSFTMDANNGSKDNPERNNELDLSEPYELLIPFVDVNWFTKKHHEKDIRYRFEFKYNEIHEIIHVEEGVMNASNVHEGPFAMRTDRNNLPSHMPWNQQIGDLHFDEVIYTNQGVWWKMHYIGDKPRPTYLVGEFGANSNFCPYPSAHGNYKVDHYESCFLPYPRLKDPNYQRERCSLYVGNGHERRILNPPIEFALHNGDWEIIGTSLSGSNHAATHTRSVTPLPLAEPSKAPPEAAASETKGASTPPASSPPVQSEPVGFFQRLIEKIKAIFN